MNPVEGDKSDEGQHKTSLSRPDKRIEKKIDVSGAEKVLPSRSAPIEPMSEREREGVRLLRFILWITIVFIVLSIAFLWYMEARIGTLDPTGAAVDTLKLRLAETERASLREFWLGWVRLILVNVLLPIITALLGYVFGTHRASVREGGSTEGV